MKYAILTVFILSICSCRKGKIENTATSLDLNGKWIEVTTRADTLTFGLWGGGETMILDRGKEMTNGYLLPKSGSGPYDYKLSGGKISLRWMLSSSSGFYDYDFQQTDNKLTIGNFYGSFSAAMLSFERLN